MADMTLLSMHITSNGVLLEGDDDRRLEAIVGETIELRAAKTGDAVSLSLVSAPPGSSSEVTALSFVPDVVGVYGLQLTRGDLSRRVTFVAFPTAALSATENARGVLRALVNDPRFDPVVSMSTVSVTEPMPRLLGSYGRTDAPSLAIFGGS